MKTTVIAYSVAFFAPLLALAEKAEKRRPEPIIDMHLHALSSSWWGGWKNFTYNVEDLTVTESEEALMRQSLARMREFNIVKAFTMYGSDQMIWPEAIAKSIDAIESADVLTPEQKRDIFYNNAARFLRLSEAEIARHHVRAAE